MNNKNRLYDPLRYVADIRAEKIKRHQRLKRHFAVLLRVLLMLSLPLGLVLLFLFASCSTEDDRDACCEGVVIDFRYSRGAANIFPSHIHSMRHYLFDARGVLSRVIEGRRGDLQRLSFDKLGAGTYSLISIGNAGAPTRVLRARRIYAFACSRCAPTTPWATVMRSIGGCSISWPSATNATAICVI